MIAPQGAPSPITFGKTHGHFGIKKMRREGLVLRFAATLRDGGSYSAMNVGVSAGIGIYWK